jgi:hypothetical protein
VAADFSQLKRVTLQSFFTTIQNSDPLDLMDCEPCPGPWIGPITAWSSEDSNPLADMTEMARRIREAYKSTHLHIWLSEFQGNIHKTTEEIYEQVHKDVQEIMADRPSNSGPQPNKKARRRHHKKGYPRK